VEELKVDIEETEGKILENSSKIDVTEQQEDDVRVEISRDQQAEDMPTNKT
jgi:hypothetical protein